MKINRKTSPEDRRSSRGVKTKKGARTGVRPAAGGDFKKELKDISQQELREQLDNLLKVIDSQGEELKKTRDNKVLLEYRRKVKEFLQIVQREYSRTRQFSSWDKKGNLKTYRLIEQIDDRLEELYQLFLKEQTDSLDILKRLDEIRGLLLDLYI